MNMFTLYWLWGAKANYHVYELFGGQGGIKKKEEGISGTLVS